MIMMLLIHVKKWLVQATEKKSQYFQNMFHFLVNLLGKKKEKE